MLLWREELSINLFLIFAFPHRRCFIFWLIGFLLLRVYMSVWELFLISAGYAESHWICWVLPYYVHLPLRQSVFFLLPTLPPQAISKLLQLFSTHTEFTHLALSQCKGCNKPVHEDVWKLLLMIPQYAILSITFIS